MDGGCIGEISKAIGRDLSEQEFKNLESQLVGELREMARSEPQRFAGLSRTERLTEASNRMQEKTIAEATKQAQRSASNLAAQLREADHLRQRSQTIGEKNGYHAALFERLSQVYDYIAGVRNELFGHLVDTIRAAEPRFMGLVENAKATHDFVQEVFGKDTGNEIAKKGAKAYLEAMETIRTRLNAAGASIGKLDYSWLPQPHDAAAIFKAGKDAWVNYVLPRMARDRFVKENGALMNDAEMHDLLSHAFDTLSTEGMVKREPGQSGLGSRAARFDDAHRILHFKDADAYSSYMTEFGKGSVFEAIHNHVNAQAKNIGLMEQMGANSNNNYRYLKDLAEIEDSRVAGKAVRGARKFGATLDMVWDLMNGTTATPVDQRLAARGQQIRNYMSAVKLGGVMLSSINDAGTWVAVARYNGIPLGKAFAGVFKSLGTNSEDAARMGLAVESMSGEMQTWHAENMRQDWTSKLANTTMRLQGIEAWTHRLRGGLSLMLQDHLASLTKSDFAQLSKFDQERFTQAGVTPKDWQIWQAAKPENIGGRDLLTAKSIRDVDGFTSGEINQATARLLGFLDGESKTGVIAPDLFTRATITQGSKAGTVGGEIARSLMLFKSFPAAVMFQQIQRIKTIARTKGTASAAAYSVSLLTGMTILGALAMQLKDLASGKDPRDMTTGKAWGAAFAQGGGLGVFGDIMYTGFGGNSRNGQANWTNLAGPVASTAADALNVTLGNIGEAIQGKESHMGAELLRFAKQNTPFINLWYLRSAIDHMLLHDMQENLSPGYLSNMRERAQHDFGQDYWWQPGEGMPSRAPNMATIAGDQ